MNYELLAGTAHALIKSLKMNRLALFLTLAVSAFLAGCDCQRMECIGNGTLNFDLISKADGTTNLLGSGQFSVSQLKLDLLLKTPGIAPPPTTTLAAGGFSIIQVVANANLSGVIIQLAGFEPDTVFTSASALTVKSRCCGGTFEVFNSVVHKGVELSDGSGARIRLFK